MTGDPAPFSRVETSSVIAHPRYRLGIDIGGTFTDVTLMDEATGVVRTAKVLTTPEDPSEGSLVGVLQVLRTNDVPGRAVRLVVHATTVATNAIIEGKVSRTGFVTTDGFSDLLEIGRQARPSTGLYDVLFEKPRPLVPRYLCYGVPERLDAGGRVLVAFNEQAARQVAESLGGDGVQAVAVCFLHSYLNPDHELRMAEILRAAMPDVFVSLSAEVAPEFREYFRASTTVVNASVRPIVSRYLTKIDRQLREAGVEAELLIMQSSGGVYSAAAASERPVFMVESGPAAGVVAANFLGHMLGHRDIISFDMGGTTAKVALIQDGHPRVTKEYEVGATARQGTSGQAGSGYPIRTPVIDLVEIGAGGGSIAWVDSGGALRVGPQSAGAAPGPACYGKGGEQPTVTDAHLILGRLDPHYFLGGGIPLDVERARVAVARCAERLGLAVVETAHAILEIANTAMVGALRLVSVQRGCDPRELTMVAFGGAGPLHVNRLAEESGVGAVVIPLSPGTTSAMGLLVSDLKREHSQTLIQRVDRLDPTTAAETFRRLEDRGRVELLREGTRPEDLTFLRQVELRYVGQSHELTVEAPSGGLNPQEMTALLRRFHREHDRAYGYSAPGEPVEFVTLRVTAVGRITKPQLRDVLPGSMDVDVARKASRHVYFAEASGFVSCPIYDRYRLGAGHRISGPAICEEFDSTTVIHPGYQASVDRFGNLLLARY